MISSKLLVNHLINNGFTRFSGTPCSYLAPLINEVSFRKETNYVPASNEGEALTLVSGMWVGGKYGVVLCQNSGLGNMVNPLTSLNLPFGIPVLLIISIRGKPGESDEPQHKVMGEITKKLLDLIGIPWRTLPKDGEKALVAIKESALEIEKTQAPYALLVEKSTFLPENPQRSSIKLGAEVSSSLPTREEVIKATLSVVSDSSIIVTTTGKTSRELNTLDDRSSNFYCVGAMGYANSIAHGIALSTSSKVFILDGDGAAIMHLGNLATIGASKASNFIHILLDNETYDSTGGQSTVSTSVSFIDIAMGCGYKKAISCSSISEYKKVISSTFISGPVFIHMKIKPGSMEQLGRPDVTPHFVTRRLKEFINKRSAKSYEKVKLLNAEFETKP